MRLTDKNILLVLLLILSGCASEIGSFNVEGESQPRFTFDTNQVSLLLVYRTLRKYLNGGIPLAEFSQNNSDERLGMKNNPNMQWAIEGKHDARIPITYGNVPEGMKEIVPAKPLAENTAYFVCTHIGRSAYSFAGRAFIIRDGRTIEVQGHLDEKSVDN
jgi:hypothetical protein